MPFKKDSEAENVKQSFYKLVIGNVLIFVLLMFFVFLGLEGYYRYWYDESDSFGVTHVSKRWLSRYYIKNNFDLRDNIDYQISKVPGKRRITFIGDSFTAGHGIKNVNDRFANIIRSKKNETYEIHVLAINGVDTGAEAENLARIMDMGYKLEDVVLVYCLNDIGDLTEEMKLQMNEVNKQPDRLKFFLEYSYFFNTLYYRWRIVSNPKVSKYFDFLTSAYKGKTWEVQKRRLLHLNKLVYENGGKLKVVIFPFLHSIAPNYPFLNTHKQLQSFLSKARIPYVDLLPFLGEFSPEELTVNNFDAHPNEFAHSIAAKNILEFLEQN